MTNFKIKKGSSTVNWTGKKALGLHTGSINVATGNLEYEDGIIVGGEIEIDMTSIVVTDIDDTNTNQEFLNHLLNEDFFSVEKFKHSKLVITKSTKADNNKLKIDGILTIKDISHQVSFTASVEVFTNTLHALGELVIDRTKYNIRYGSGKFFENLGDKLIYDDFILQFKIIAEA